MINFTVGPVMSGKEILELGKEQIPYFRTTEFSKLMLENECLIKKFFKAKNDSRVLFMTGSGTASMDAVVLNTLTVNDKILVVNGGSFGQRFCDICETYDLDYTPIRCEMGKTLTKESLYAYDSKGYTALLVNLDETSTGVLYDIEMISMFCKKNNLFLIVDSISSFLCDPFDMDKLGVNIVITGSQKALALAPGISIICMDSEAIKRIENNKPKSYYFNLKFYLRDGERGQTPFTPAVGILLQLNKRLLAIEKSGGVDSEIEKTKARAQYFRNKIVSLNMPFDFYADVPSNAVTALICKDENISAYKIFEILKNEYNIWICPNGGVLKEKVFRVGHIGDLTFNDYDILLKAFADLKKRSII